MKIELLEPGNYYHIYNRGNNREDIFFEPGNYLHFLNLFDKYIHLAAKTYAYCLLKNHFHFLVRIHEEKELPEYFITDNRKISSPFSNLFNSYAKSINIKYGRTSSLFQERFKRKMIVSNEQLKDIIYFIHSNPVNHNIIRDFKKYPYSSFNTILSEKESKISRKEVLKIFGGRNNFIEFHETRKNQKGLFLKELEDSDFD
jgi:REP element-mobilizing transposase RayT